MMTNEDTRPQTQALIRKAIDAGGSTRSIAARANRAGYEISHSYINNLANGLVTSAPKTTLIEALAEGLGVPVATVRRAVIIDWYNYDPLEGGDFTARAVPADLSETERAAHETRVRAWLIARRNG